MTKLLLAATAAILIAGPAFAAEAQGDVAVKVVSARGVEFSSQEQTRQFYVKLHAAARAVCDGGSRMSSAVDAGCVREVVARAVKVADKPVLTAMFNRSDDANHAFAGNDQ